MVGGYGPDLSGARYRPVASSSVPHKDKLQTTEQVENVFTAEVTSLQILRKFSISLYDTSSV